MFEASQAFWLRTLQSAAVGAVELSGAQVTDRVRLNRPPAHLRDKRREHNDRPEKTVDGIPNHLIDRPILRANANQTGTP